MVAQTPPRPPEINLVAHYAFDANLADNTGDTGNGGVASGVTEFACGVSGTSLALNGGNDFVRIPGGNTNNVNRVFGTENFTLSFYFKSIGVNGTQYLFAKRDTNCNNLQYITIAYAPLAATLRVRLRQSNQEARIDYPIRNDDCWQHVALVRRGSRLTLWHNGEEVAETATSSTVDLTNDGEILIGSTACRQTGETAFDGLIDEVRIYVEALSDNNVRSLYASPDRILTTTRRVFLGEEVPIELNSNCGVAFQWIPSDGVDSPDDPEPLITPQRDGRQAFTVEITDAESNCVARDSIVFQVIDPTTLDCNEIFFPKAFTPNGIGPVENETFGIANPFAIEQLVSFEIYDRYGGQMFRTDDAFARWDGTFQGEEVQPGPVVWRIVYRCKDVEQVESGSVMVLR